MLSLRLKRSGIQEMRTVRVVGCGGSLECRGHRLGVAGIPGLVGLLSLPPPLMDPGGT